VIPKVKKFTSIIPKVKKSISWKPTEMIPKYRNVIRDNFEGENQISWNPAEMIRKVKIP
jgi:hypothetical protein